MCDFLWYHKIILKISKVSNLKYKEIEHNKMSTSFNQNLCLVFDNCLGLQFFNLLSIFPQIDQKNYQLEDKINIYSIEKHNFQVLIPKYKLSDCISNIAHTNIYHQIILKTIGGDKWFLFEAYKMTCLTRVSILWF